MKCIEIHAYQEQCAAWPENGTHIMAQFDDDSIIVYQAFSAEIAKFAIRHQYFGAAFSYTRMSWIKPNFLWMMFRSGWAKKPGQEHILAIRLKRSFFDEVLQQAVASSYDASLFSRQDEWKQAIQNSNVRLQWDPDHDPLGNCLKRRALQLGLRGDMLRRYGKEEILEIHDITSFATEQSQYVSDIARLQTPAESIYRSYQD